MKRKLLFTSCLLLFTALAIFSCSKDNVSLDGTIWEGFNSGATAKAELTFQTKMKCRLILTYTSSSSTEAVVADYTYEYEHPNVRMYPIQSGMAEMKGIIDKKTMSLINVSSGKEAVSLTKK